MTAPATYNLKPYVGDMIGLQRSIGGNMILQEFLSNKNMTISWHNIQGETKAMSFNDFLAMFINALNRDDLHYADTDRVVLLQNSRVALGFPSTVITEASSTLDYERLNVIRDSMDNLSSALTRVEEVLASEPVMVVKQPVEPVKTRSFPWFKLIMLLVTIIVLVVLYYFFFVRGSEGFHNRCTVVLRS